MPHAALHTGNSTVAAPRNQPVTLYSDLLTHMGPGLEDGVSQGQAGPREFRTAPLWGLGPRLFFLHGGRTSDLREAIRAHRSGNYFTGNESEANGVVKNFNKLPHEHKRDLLNSLRSLQESCRMQAEQREARSVQARPESAPRTKCGQQPAAAPTPAPASSPRRSLRISPALPR